jgi:hypothetical protein
MQLGPEIFISTGMGVQVGVGIKTQRDITGTFGTGVSGLTNDATRITSTAKEKFQTSGNENISGTAGDVFLGGALNMLYAVTDVLLYNFDTCELEQSTTLMMQPDGLATTFIYTENHIAEVIIPELESIKNYYISKNQPDSAAWFDNQLSVWRQVIDSNHQNISEGNFIENKTFSSGIVYENSVQTTRSASHSFNFDFYLDYGVAVDIGASVGGIGIFGGVAVKGKSQWGSVVSNDTSKTTTIGYVLSDDDTGDSFTVDIKEDKVYGVPAFSLVAGRSSCPWEKGTLPREGVQLISNSYSQVVEESQKAVYVLQLGNTSQSNEPRTYHLVFDHTSNPDGAVITLGGSPMVGNVPYPYTIPAGQGINATVTVGKGPLASEFSGLKFTLKSPCDDQISDDVYLDALFYKNYTLTVAVNGSGTTNVPVGTQPCREGSVVVLYASPSEGNKFQKWIVGTDEFNSRAIQVTMDANKTATAYFVPDTSPQYSLQVSNVGNGTTIPPIGTHFFTQGSSVTLNAFPAIDNAFVKWVINSTEVTDYQTDIILTRNTTAVAYFIETHLLTVEVASGNGFTTPSAETHIYHHGSVIHLYASPSPGNLFDKWIINSIVYTTREVDITITSDLNAKAYFVPTTEDQDTLTVVVTGSGTTIPPAGQHYYKHGSTISLKAYPNAGMVFEKWIINSNETSDNPVLITFTGDVSVQAFFKDDPTNETTHQIRFIKGWSLFSVKNTPADSDLKAVFQPLISDGSLVKIQDETGNALEDLGFFGGWQNNIGNIRLTEGYKIKVTRDCRLILSGAPATYPFKIPLKAGWNIIGYPRLEEADALSVVRQLIDRGKLIKVQDETGNSIEDLGVFGSWQNNIGNFKHGEGYKIKVNASDTIILNESYPKSVAVVSGSVAPVHFHPVTEGNGVDHMNINLVRLPSKLIRPGDEIAVFDGDLCVGAIKFTVLSLQFKVHSLAASADDGDGRHGFTEGNPFTLKIWKAGMNTGYTLKPEIVKGTSTFLKHESVSVSLEKSAIPGIDEKPLAGDAEVKIYPNPTTGKLNIHCRSLSCQGMQVQVVNSVGQMIINRFIETDPGEIDLSGNTSGVYYIRITHNSAITTEKVLLR